MRGLAKQDLIDVAYGATFLGSGGGGTLSTTLEMIDRWFPADGRVNLLGVEEAVADAESATAVVTFIGSPAANRELTDLTPAIRATELLGRTLERRHGLRLGQTLAVELGVQSSAVVHLLVARALGLDAVDGDGVGRAVPWLAATTFAGAEVPTGPAVLASAEASHLLVEESDPETVQAIASRVIPGPPFDGVAGLALWPMDGEALVRALPPTGGTRGTVGLAAALGRLLVEGREEIESRLIDVLERHGVRATMVFRGRLERVHQVSSADHLVLELVGDDGSSATCHSASENLVFRLAGRPIVVAPDSICALTADGRPISNTELPPLGTRVVFFAVEARPILRENPRLVRVFRRMTDEVGYSGGHVPFGSAPQPSHAAL